MRHLRRTVKLGRTSQHRDSMLANLVGSLIRHERVRTTVARAKAARPVAEKLVTLGKKGSLHHRRLAIAALHENDLVHKLFAEIAPRFKNRAGGYTRILKLGSRVGDAAPIALLEWVDRPAAEAAPAKQEKDSGKARKETEVKPKPGKKK
ncbi:MAG: 50S ribosomal protein L17 [Verrucomicrobia bacterium]|nr:50S ribosomal protein L17 [Verrucomicrobiota bacterium]NBU68819.1 50S ribosomal protein L17 [Verrucomicrobiota bacterium]